MYSQPSEAGLASLLASRGRNGDSMLVHMTPSEVQGLQSLAYAAGGQLSVNPVTGLYEANFLKKLLPAILGFGLSFIPGVGPLMAAGLVGAGEGIRTGDLGKGLMAGLGAFGGAGLGAGLAGAAKAGSESALQEFTTTAAKKAAEKAATAPAGGLFSPAGPGAAFARGATGTVISPAAGGAAAQTAAAAAQPTAFQTMGQGVRALGNKFGREGFMQAIPGGKLGIAAGGMGLANALTPDVQFPDADGQIDQSYYESEGYDPVTGTFRGGQWRKGYPGFPPRGMAEGGDVTAPSYDTSLADYMSQLNQFVTSPVAPPRPPAPPPAAVAPPGAGSPIAGGDRWDPVQGRFVRGGGAPAGGDFSGIDFSQLNDLMGGRVGDFGGINFAALQNYLGGAGGGGGDMRWDPNMGQFVPSGPAAGPAAGPPMGGGETMYAGGTQGFYDRDFSGMDPFAGGMPDFSGVDMSGLNPFAGGMPPQQMNEPMMPPQMPPPQMPPPQMPPPQMPPPQMPPPQMPPPQMPPPQMQPPMPPMPPQMGQPPMQPPMPPVPPMPPQMGQPPMQPPMPPMPPQMQPPMQPPEMAELYPFMDEFDAFDDLSPFSTRRRRGPEFNEGGEISPNEYEAGGTFLRGPGDGMSDDIKANINGEQEARLADGEFVIPADVVSHLGNGSSEAGSRKLYAMMDRIREARTGKKRQAPEVKVDKYLPA